MTIESVKRAAAILNMFSREKTEAGITEISKSLGVTKGAVHNLVSTLVECSLLKRDPESRKYSLGLKSFELAMIQPEIADLNENASGPTIELTRSKRMTSRVGIWDRKAILVTITNYPRNRPELSGSIGPRIHAYSSSLGKSVLAHLSDVELEEYFKHTELVPFTPSTITDRESLLAELKEARLSGLAWDREESLLGTACLGAPLFGKNGQIIGAVSLSTVPARMLKQETYDDIAQDLLRTAETISRGLGYTPPASVIDRTG